MGLTALRTLIPKSLDINFFVCVYITGTHVGMLNMRHALLSLECRFIFRFNCFFQGLQAPAFKG